MEVGKKLSKATCRESKTRWTRRVLAVLPRDARV